MSCGSDSRHLERLLELTGVAWFFWDRGQDQFKVSSTFRALLGQGSDDESQFSAAHLQERIFAKDLPRTRQVMDPILDGEVERDAFGVDFRLKTSDGPCYVVVEFEILRRDASGRAVELHGVVRDVDDSRRQLLQKLAEIDKLSSLGIMAGGIAHEINNPLAIITSAVIGIKRAVNDDDRPKIFDRLERMLRAVDRIARIVTSLKRYSGNPAEVRVVRHPIALMVDEATAICGPRLKKEGIDLQIAMDTERFVNCNHLELQQVVLNLVNNAADAVVGRPRRLIRIEGRDIGEQVEIRVKDSGEGVPLEYQRRIFEPFFSTKEHGRTGLGLAIAKNLVESMSGEFFLDASEEMTTFVIRLNGGPE